MARILVATVPLTGHVSPMLVLVRALTQRGHEIPAMVFAILSFVYSLIDEALR